MSPREGEARRRVLIVDDDQATREMLTLALELDGYEVSQASNGLRLVSTLQVDRPDLVLLDVRMDWIDGFELCRSIKKNRALRDIPIVFISGCRNEQDVRCGLEAGAADYFVKPLDLDLLKERIGALVRRGAMGEHPN